MSDVRLVALLVCVWGMLEGVAPAAEKPNIVFILADDKCEAILC